MIDVDKIRACVSTVNVAMSRGLELAENSTEWRGACPFCVRGELSGNDRFAVFKNTGYWNCRQCKKRGDVIEFIIQFDGVTFNDAVAILSNGLTIDSPTVIKKPSDNEQERLLEWRYALEPFVYKSLETLATSTDDNVMSAYRWLKSRGVTLANIGEYGLGYNSKWYTTSNGLKIPPSLVIPYWNCANELYAVQLYIAKEWQEKYGRRRFVRGSKPKLAPFGINRVKSNHKIVFWGEGELDCIVANNNMPHSQMTAVCTNGAESVPSDLSWCKNRSVVSIHDMDDGGRSGYDKLCDILGRRIRRVTLPENDITECYKQDVDIKNLLYMAVNRQQELSI